MARSESVWLTLACTLGFAIFFATASHDARAWIGGALIGYLFAQRIHVGRRVDELERRVRSAADGSAAATAPPAAPVATVEPAPPSPPRPATEPARTAPAAGEAVPPLRAATETPAPREATPSRPGAFDEWLGRALAWLKGGNPLARVGIVILFIGGSFLAKYASDHALLPLELRLAALAAGALVLLGFGWRLRASRRVYAQILQGGGIAGLYLTVFAATRLYHLLPHSLALPLLVAAALASAVLAVAQESLALAVIGFAGGFLAPVLLSTGGGSHVALFTYYAVLNAGVFAVAWYRAWRVLNLVGFTFTFGIVAAWRSLSYVPGQLVSTDFFLLLFFAMYVAISILFALRQKPDLRGYVSGTLVFGLPVAVFTLQATLVSRLEYGLAFSALGFGLFYLALAWALFVARRPGLALLAEAFAALGVVFASLAIPLAFDRQTTAAMWAVEGAGLLWIGVRQQRRLARAFGALLQLAGGIGYLGGLGNLDDATPVLNSACVGAVLLAAAGAASARWLQRNPQRAPHEHGAEIVAALWSAWWWWYGGLQEISRHAPPSVELGAALAFAALSLVIAERLGQRWQWRVPARIAAAQLPLAAVGGLLAAADAGHPFAEYGFAGWALMLAAGLWLLHRQDRDPDELLAPAQPWLHGGLYWLAAALSAWEGSWQVVQAAPGVWAQLPWGLAPAALIWAASRPRPWPSWPLARHAAAYRLQGSVPLGIWAAGWLLSTNLASAGDPGWLPYVPLLNPLDLASMLVLLALVHGWLALEPARRDLLDRRIPWSAFAALAFVWLNAALVRALHYGFDTPLHFHGIRHSFLVQASLSIFWSLLGIAAMTLAARRGWRAIWLVGAALMGVVVLKLFLVDLEGTGTLARIVSFLTVGALLLAAGYLSPLPPGKAPEKAPA